MAVNFAKGKVYGIRNDVNDKVYIGITGQTLKERWYAHKTAKISKASKLYVAMQDIGIEHFEMFLIEDYPTDTLQKLMEREKFYIKHFNSINDGYNTNISARTKEERKQYKTTVDKAYREAKGQELLDKKKAYYQQNKETIKENVKRHQENNKEARQAYMNEYAKKNKDKLREYRREYHLKMRAKQQA